MDPSIDVLVLRKGTHGMAANAYGEELRSRLPKMTVRLAKTPAQEQNYVADATVVTGVSIRSDLLDAAEHLDLFACTWAGTGHLPMDALKAADVTVTNASGIHAPNIAETAIGHILVYARRLREGWERKKRKEWRHFRAFELAGSTVTVLGQGPIGKAVVERLHGFDVETIGVRYTPKKGGPADTVIGFHEDDLHEALADTSYLVIASPLTDTTRGLIGTAELDTLPPTAVVVNVARGGIVDTNALESALRTQRIRGAALDVTDPEPLPTTHPLWNYRNVVITPHNAGHSPKHWNRLASIVAPNVNRMKGNGDDEPLQNVVFEPE